MKTLQIKNAREIFFTSKEQYLHFRKVWSQAVNSEKAKKTRHQDSYGTWRKSGWLTATHHMVYALLRGRDAMNGFTPITSRNKLENGSYINEGLYEARNELRSSAGSNKNNEALEKFLEPFEGTVTLKMLGKLSELCATVELLESNYGKGGQIAKLILASKTKPTSYAEMWTMYEEVA